MGDNSDPKSLRFVSIDLEGLEGRIEVLQGREAGPEKLRIACWSQDRQSSRPLEISENELASLLQRAIRAGILSVDFLKDLHSEFEI